MSTIVESVAVRESRERGVLSVVVFLLDGQRYGLPLTACERVVRMVAVSPLPASPEVVLGAINVHGDVVAVVDVRRRLGVGDSVSYGPEARLLLVRLRDLRLAFPVDDVGGVVEIAEHDVVPSELDHLLGIARLGDGLLLVQDVERFLSADEARAVAVAVEAAR